MKTKLIYIGNGGAFVGVPARDLTEEDFAERAEQWAELGITEELLVNSGLYKKNPVESVIDFIEEEHVEPKAPRKGKAKKDGE